MLETGNSRDADAWTVHHLLSLCGPFHSGSHLTASFLVASLDVRGFPIPNPESSGQRFSWVDVLRPSLSRASILCGFHGGIQEGKKMNQGD